MGRVYCVVPGCASKSPTESISFHEIPSNESVRGEWLKNIRRDGWTPSSQSKICSLHFEVDCFKTGQKIRCLKQDSIPTIFNSYPKRIQRDIKRSSKKWKRTVAVKEPSPKRNKQKANPDIVNVGRDVQSETKNVVASSSTGIQRPPTETGDHSESPGGADFCKTPSSGSPEPIKTIAWESLFSAHKVKCKLRSNTNKVAQLTKRVSDLERKNSRFVKELEETKDLEKVCAAAENHDELAVILLEQVNTFGKGRVQWSENLIRRCAVLHHMFPSAYRHLSSLELLRMPCTRTLDRYVESTGFKTDMVPPIVQCDVYAESERLSPVEEVASLMCDEI